MSASSDIPPRPAVRIVNCVCTFSLNNRTIDLNELVARVPFCEFNRRKFAAASLRLRSPRSTCLIFSSGNLVVTGSRCEHEALLASHRYTAALNRYFEGTLQMRNFRIQNIVASAVLPWNMNLVDIAAAWQTYCSYEPEVFPGLIFRLKNTVLLLFRSGKIVITGAKSRTTVRRVYNEIYEPLLVAFADKNNLVSNSADYRVQQLHETTLRLQQEEL